MTEMNDLNEAGPPDLQLAALMRRLKPKVPIEEFEHVNYLATALSYEAGHIKLGWRIVKLKCGHLATTKAQNRCGCRVCHQMIMEGRDYQGFRNGTRY